MTAQRELIEYLAGDDEELSCYLNEQDAAGLARLCATTLLVNGPRVRELLGWMWLSMCWLRRKSRKRLENCVEATFSQVKRGARYWD